MALILTYCTIPENNWADLDAAVSKHRPLAEVHHAAMCPIGEDSVCLDPHSEILHDAMNAVVTGQVGCENPVPCYSFNTEMHYSLLSLDIEGFEWEFLKFRNIRADMILMEVCQFAREPGKFLGPC